MMIRLNKYLSECGIASRRKVEELILAGRVEVNGKVNTELAIKVDPEKDIVALDGERVKRQTKVYYLLNKPKGYVTTTSDEKKRQTVMDLVKTNQKIFPVGRLDFNTTGVLLLTNDGDFANLLLHPNNKVPRIYKVTLDKPLSFEDKDKLIKGIYIEEKKGKFEEIRFSTMKNRKIVTVLTVEGRNHFVKNMFNALNYKVSQLYRISYAHISVGLLKPGTYRELRPEEVQNIFKKYGKPEQSTTKAEEA